MVRNATMILFTVLFIGMMIAPAYAESSPRDQLKNGTPINQIQCNENKILMESPTGKPVCLTQATSEKLIKRGYLPIEAVKTTQDNADVIRGDSKSSVSRMIKEPKPNLTFEFPREFVVGQPVTLNYTLQWEGDSKDYYKDRLVHELFLTLPEEFSTDATRSTLTLGEIYTPHTYYSHDNLAPYSESTSGQMSITLTRPMTYEYDWAKIGTDARYQIHKTDAGAIFKNDAHVYRGSSSSDGTEISLNFVDRDMRFIKDGVHNPIPKPEPRVRAESGEVSDYVPKNIWEGFADFVRHNQNTYDVTDVQGFLLNTMKLSQRFVDDFFVEYPEFRTQSTDSGPSGQGGGPLQIFASGTCQMHDRVHC